jgi:hypothetical protein
MRIRIFYAALLILVINVMTVYAQTDPGEPCDGADPDGGNCPLDTWVVGFVIVATLFTVLHLRHKQKSQSIYS